MRKLQSYLIFNNMYVFKLKLQFIKSLRTSVEFNSTIVVVQISKHGLINSVSWLMMKINTVCHDSCTAACFPLTSTGPCIPLESSSPCHYPSNHQMSPNFPSNPSHLTFLAQLHQATRISARQWRNFDTVASYGIATAALITWCSLTQKAFFP